MRLSVVTIAMLLAANFAVAQPPAGGRPDAAQRLERLATLLDLTDTQKLQVQQVLDEEHAKMQTLHDQMKASGQKPSFDQIRATHEQLHQETLAAVKPILTTAQYNKFVILSQGHGGPRGWHHAAPATPATTAAPATTN
jgi:Spy/CpxP family protein refolding chaperone